MSDSFTGQVDINYLEQAARTFVPLKQASYERMQISPGQRVLDVGCGPGLDTIELSKIVTQQGTSIGVDHSDEMIAEATEKARQLKIESFVKFQQADAENLPFETEYFDSCRSERLFMHLPRPELVLTEMTRVIKPSGKIVVMDTDWPSLSIDCDYPWIEQALSGYRNNKVLTSGFVGRKLYRMFKNQSLTDINIEIIPLHTTDLNLFYALSVQETVENQAVSEGVISQQQLDEWRLNLRENMENDVFFASVNIIILSAGKPK